MAEITIPSVGIAMEEALVVKWLKQPGESVALEEPVVEIETDKATMEIVSPAAGTLGPHLVEAGEIAAVGATIVHVLDPGAEPVPSPEQTAPHPATASEEPAASAVASVVGGEEAEGERAAHGLSPRARRLAREREQQPAGGHAEPGEGRFRELIATKVAESWREIPHFTVSREVDAESMQALLAELRQAGFEPNPTFTDLLLRALALALAETGSGGEVDVGLAVATANGVVIPAVRDVLGQGPAELSRSRRDAVERALKGKLNQDDLAASPSSTLSNLGSFGVDEFTGIIALGQTSLLTVGRARLRVVADTDRTVSVRARFNSTLNADHRGLDGAQAARLLVAFANAAEGLTLDAWEKRG